MIPILLHDNLTFRMACIKDISAIWEIMHQAKAHMKNYGSRQWDDDYPAFSTIEDDIERNEGYVICKDQEIVIYGVISFAGEPVYDQIDDKWPNKLPYLTIHRLAVNDKFKQQGFAQRFFQLAEKEALKSGITNFRIDTNFDNAFMLHLIDKMGFHFAGEVVYRGTETRRAFWKTIIPKPYSFGCEGYTLREITYEDAKPIFQGLNKYRDDMRQWLPFVDNMQKLSDEQAVVESFLMPKYAIRNLTYVIEHGGIFCGMIGMSGLDLINDRLEIGYWLLPPYRGKGIMTAATKALCKWIFKHRPINRIQIKCSVDNHASNAIPKRIGFKFEGTEREGQLLASGKYTDINVYSLLKKDKF